MMTSMKAESSVRRLTLALAVLASLHASVALAQDAAAPSTNKVEDDVVEKVAVRNRLYNPGGRLELSPHVSFMILNQLTDHINFNLGAAYNVSDTLAFELRGGYALSRHTGLAKQVSEQLLQRDPKNEVKITDDLANLWEMNANAILGVRWQPIYGKLSLLAELPVHFQTYLWVGGGGATFKRESIVYCKQVTSRADGTCGDWLTETKAGPVGSAAFGFRFFTHQKGGITLEVRNYIYPDSYRVSIDRGNAEKGSETEGTPKSSPGLTTLWMFDLGYTYIF